jgi:hypothetical protein
MKTDPDSESFATIRRFYHPTDAHIAAGRLRSEGIPILMPEINHASANWLLATALGGIRLQVPTQFKEAAEEVLSESDQGEPIEDKTCPSCFGERITSSNTSWKIAFLAIHLFSLPLPWRQNSHRCLDCNTQWESQVDY